MTYISARLAEYMETDAGFRQTFARQLARMADREVSELYGPRIHRHAGSRPTAGGMRAFMSADWERVPADLAERESTRRHRHA